ncbi:MAG: methyltransferase domain-containing protein [Xanthobacteraceae bacterium]|nr:methyltransferase domain-containing protein [Xanthobacteraceae bacterium]MCW5673185.1 methyltransferase domain-containing protein [Xanthobacteraceae bacterium]
MAKGQHKADKDEAPGLTARRFAADALLAILHGRRALEDVFEHGETGRQFRALDERDRALSRMIVATALRRAGSLQAVIERFLQSGWPEDVRVHAILLSGAAQILLLEVADHAAVDLSVDLANEIRNKRYAGLVNAVLRRVSAEGPAILETLAPEIDTQEWMRARWLAAYGEEALRAIVLAHRVEPALDITPKENPEALAAELDGVVLPTGSVRVTGKGAVAELPGYHEGAWWVQDAAASIPAKLLGNIRGLRVADLCAAPGGKTLQLANAGARVTAIDRSAPRLKRLSQNLARTKLQAEVIVADAATWEAEPFDAILLDAPCSATGTVRRHPDILWQKSPEDLAQVTKLQARLLDNAAKLLKPGGLLVYSTCSLEPEEGEMQIADLLSRNPALERIAIRAEEAGDPAALTARGELRTLPFHFPNADPRLSGCDGFFASRLQRKA